MLDVDTATLGDFADNVMTEPDDACVNYDNCGNVVPHNGQMCGPCLAAARRSGRGTDNVS